MFYVPKDTQKTYTTTFKDFKGVDFSNSKLNVEPFRATDMKNMVYDGVNHKRPSWIEVLKLDGKINGCWSFRDSDGNIQTIVHSGNKIYRITKENEDDGFDVNSIKTKEIDITPNEVTINDERSFGIVRENKLYILCGTYLVYDGEVVKPVADDEDTYIPTTTIGITREDSTYDTRTSFEAVNMLSSKRKNKMIGTPFEDMIINIGDTIDTKLAFYTHINFTKLTEDTTIFQSKWVVEGGYELYSIKYQHSPRLIYYDKSTNTGEGGYVAENIWTASNEWVKLISDFEFKGEVLINKPIGNDYFCYKTKENTYILDTLIDNERTLFDIDYLTLQNINGNVSYKVNTIELQKLKVDDFIRPMDLNITIGKVETTLDGKFTKVIFYTNFAPVMEGQSNITVTFTKKNQTNIDAINGCKFAELWSVKGGHYLFMSGNSNKPNIDWHSDYSYDSTMQVYSDFTYIPDLSYTIIGSEEDNVMGYTIIGDDTLSIQKEANGQRDTLYLRTASLDYALTYGGKEYYKVAFHLTQGATGEGVISSYCSDNLLNDNLFLSKNGVFGLSLTSNIKSNERYALERSGLINGKLIKETDLSNACSVVYKGRYYLSINNASGDCYVADSRFKNYVSVDLPNTFSYEWWFWDNIKARLFFIKNDELYFGTDTGQICKFDFNTKDFADKHYKTIDSITLGIDNKFYISPNDTEVLETLKDGDRIRLKQISADEELDLYYKDVDGLTKKLDFECEVCNFDKENQSFQLLWYCEIDKTIIPYSIVIDETTPISSFEGYFVCRNNVESYFATCITDGGTPIYTKKLLSLYVTPESICSGDITVGILASRHTNIPITVEGNQVLDFSDMDFANFTFNTDDFYKVKPYKINKNCNYFGLYFGSKSDKDCAINSIIVTYLRTKLNKGVR